MRKSVFRPLVLAALLLPIAAASGCGIGGKSNSGSAGLAVTRDFGQRTLATASEDPIPRGETVMRLLQRHGRIDTRYGGRFVTAVNGVRSQSDGDRRRDWFYFVNGIESSAGAADRDLHGGDRVWWDYRDWGAAMRVPAVVGSFPEPFRHGSEGKRFPLRMDCDEKTRSACDEVMRRLNRAGLEPSSAALGTIAGKDLLRVLVGRWAEVRRDAAARQIEDGPKASGVFARIAPAGGSYQVELLDADGHVRSSTGTGTGLVAATRFEEQQPTWLVTGIDPAGVAAAARLLDPSFLRNRYAVAAVDGRAVALPVPSTGSSR